MGRLFNKAFEKFGVVPAFALHEGKLGCTEFSVYTVLCIYANKERRSWPAQTTIAEQLSITVKTVRRALKSLENKGYIEIVRPERQGKGKFNRYYIIEKRGTNKTPLDAKGGHKGDISDHQRGTPETQEQYHRTIEQKGLKNNVTFNGEDLGFSLN